MLVNKYIPFVIGLLAGALFMLPATIKSIDNYNRSLPKIGASAYVLLDGDVAELWDGNGNIIYRTTED